MKKKITFMALVLALSMSAQNLHLRNGNMETWEGSGNSTRAKYWNSVKNMSSGGLAGFAGRVIYQSTDVPEGHGLTYSTELKSRSSLNIIQNGAATTGVTNVGSATANNSNNYTYTNTSKDEAAMPMEAKPDSLRFWGRYVPAKTTPSKGTNQARFKAIIHNNTNYRDPENGNENNAVGVAVKNLDPNADYSWELYSEAFDYDSYTAYNNDPKYILITFTTNKTPGEGSDGDQFFFTKVEVVYDALLKEIQQSGCDMPAFDPRTYIYNFAVPATITSLPEITTTLQSLSATVTSNNSYREGAFTAWYDEVTLTAADNSVSRTYRVNYVELAVPTDLTASDVTSQSATASWSPVSYATSYKINWYTMDDTLVGEATTTDVNYTISGLNQTTNYYFTVQAMNCDYATAPSSQVTFATITPQTITWEQTIDTLTIGETATLTATASSNLAVTYTTNVDGIIAIEGDAITALASGTVTIYADQVGNQVFDPATRVAKEITVIKKSQTITWDDDIAALYTTDTISLSAIATSNLVVSFQSADETIAYVDESNQLIALQSGTVVITATQVGNEEYAPADAVEKIVVISKVVPSVITLPTASTITVGSTLANATLQGGEATVEGTFAWADETTSPAVGDNQAFDVVFTPTNANYYESVTVSVLVTVEEAAATNVLHVVNGASVQLYPNPVTDILYIQTSDALKAVSVYTLSGKLVSTQQVNNAREIQLNVSELAQGDYLLQMISAQGEESTQLFIKK